jgi:hypothetical protein
MTAKERKKRETKRNRVIWEKWRRNAYMRSRNKYKKEKKAERAERTTVNIKGINAKMDQAKNRVLYVNRQSI